MGQGNCCDCICPAWRAVEVGGTDTSCLLRESLKDERSWVEGNKFTMGLRKKFKFSCT